MRIIFSQVKKIIKDLAQLNYLQITNNKLKYFLPSKSIRTQKEKKKSKISKKNFNIQANMQLFYHWWNQNCATFGPQLEKTAQNSLP